MLCEKDRSRRLAPDRLGHRSGSTADRRYAKSAPGGVGRRPGQDTGKARPEYPPRRSGKPETENRNRNQNRNQTGKRKERSHAHMAGFKRNTSRNDIHMHTAFLRIQMRRCQRTPETLFLADRDLHDDIRLRQLHDRDPAIVSDILDAAGCTYDDPCCKHIHTVHYSRRLRQRISPRNYLLAEIYYDLLSTVPIMPMFLVAEPAAAEIPAARHRNIHQLPRRLRDQRHLHVHRPPSVARILPAFGEKVNDLLRRIPDNVCLFIFLASFVGFVTKQILADSTTNEVSHIRHPGEPEPFQNSHIRLQLHTDPVHRDRHHAAGLHRIPKPPPAVHTVTRRQDAARLLHQCVQPTQLASGHRATTLPTTWPRFLLWKMLQTPAVRRSSSTVRRIMLSAGRLMSQMRPAPAVQPPDDPGAAYRASLLGICDSISTQMRRQTAWQQIETDRLSSREKYEIYHYIMTVIDKHRIPASALSISVGAYGSVTEIAFSIRSDTGTAPSENSNKRRKPLHLLLLRHDMMFRLIKIIAASHGGSATWKRTGGVFTLSLTIPDQQ